MSSIILCRAEGQLRALQETCILIILLLQFAPNHTLRPKLNAPQKLGPQTCQIISSALSPPEMIVGPKGDGGNRETWALIHNMVKRTE